MYNIDKLNIFYKGSNENLKMSNNLFLIGWFNSNL